MMMHDPVLYSAKQYPKKWGIIQDDLRVSYEELITLSQFHANKILNDYSVPIGSAIGISMPKGWQQVVACLAISMAGCTFVPMSISEPPERQNKILEDAQIKLILTTKDIERTRDETHSTFQPPKLNPTDTAYIIYTSGTTGKPKGIAISHNNALNTILDINQRFEVNSEHTVLALSELNFDLAIYDIFGILAAGGCIIFPAPPHSKQPAEWLKLIYTHRINLWNSVPAYLELLKTHCQTEKHFNFLKNFKLILLSGDWISLDLARFIRSQAPATQLISLGGATEASIWSIYYKIDEVNPEWKSIPYGTPLSNQFIYILDENLQALAPGVIGDLYIGGMGVGQGYINNPKKTAESFILHPETEQIIYKTGDLAYYDPQGFTIFVGRKDHQVKINGYRIEIGEIEACLNHFKGIEKAIVSIANTESGTHLIIAHLLLKPQTLINESDLRAYIQNRIPHYMQVHHFRIINSIPLTSNGKIDRSQLTLSFGEPLTAILRQKHNFGTQRLIFAIAHILSIETQLIQLHDNFFNLGGDSIAALRLIGQLAEHGYQIDFNDILELKTIADLAIKMEESLPNEPQHVQPDPPPPHQLNDQYKVSPEQEGILFQCEYFSHPELYIGQVSIQVSETIEPQLFGNILNHVFSTHPLLRRGFDLDEEAISFTKDHIDMKSVYTIYHDIEPMSIYALERQKSFDLGTPPLIRCALSFNKIQPGTEIIVSFHHVLLDGISCITLTTFLYECYQNALRNTGSPPTLIDSIHTEKNLPQEQKQAYWTELLQDYKPLFPYYPHAENLKFSSKTFSIESLETDVLIMLWGWTLLRYDQTQNTCFGLVMSQDGFSKKSLGFFIKTPPFLMTLEENLANMLTKTKQQLNQLPRYGDTSLSEIRQWTHCPYDRYLYHSALIIDHYTRTKKQALGLNNIHTMGYTHYPLVATISEDDDHYKLKIDFHANLFSENQIDHLGGLFVENIKLMKQLNEKD